MLVTEETVEPREGDTFFATWPALPPLNVCSPPTALATGAALMLSNLMRPLMPLRRVKVKVSEGLARRVEQ